MPPEAKNSLATWRILVTPGRAAGEVDARLQGFREGQRGVEMGVPCERRKRCRGGCQIGA